MIIALKNEGIANKKVCSALYALRKQRGYSQEYVADEIGINQNTYSKLESGQTQITINRLEQLCSVVYKIDTVDFLRTAFYEAQHDTKTSLGKSTPTPLGMPPAANVDGLLGAVVEIGKRLQEMREAEARTLKVSGGGGKH